MISLSKKPTPVPLTDQDLEDEAMKQAFSITARMRQEIVHWRERAETAEADFRVQQHEHKSLAAQLRAKIEILEKQLSEVGSKLEHYRTKVLEMKQQSTDIETFYNSELARLSDQAQAAANIIISFANGSASNLKTFLDELHSKTENVDYQPLPRVDATRSISKALSLEDGPEPPPIPDFLTKGPRKDNGE